MRLYAPFDHGSRAPGSRQGCLDLLRTLGHANDVVLQTYQTPLASQLISAHVSRCALSGRTFKMIAGDHTNTYYAVRALQTLYHSMNLVIFDAHHDAYADSLCHWSFVHHLGLSEDINVSIHGVRYEEDRSTLRNMHFDPSRPTYISVDADFFPEIENVGHYVPADEETAEISYFDVFENYMNELDSAPIVGYDFCEWYGRNDSDLSFIISNIIPRLDNATLQQRPTQ